jgi:hypothetical protein
MSAPAATRSRTPSERLRLTCHISVDPDRGGHREATRAVDGRTVQAAAQRGTGGERADQVPVVDDEHHLGVQRADGVEGGAAVTDLLGVDGGGVPAHEVAEGGIRQRCREPRRRHDAEHRLGEEGIPRLSHDDPLTCDGGQQPQRIGDARVRREHERGVPAHRLVLHPSDRGIELLQRQILRQHPEATASGEGRGESRTGHRVHVRGDERHGRRGAVVRGEIDLQATGHGRVTRDEAHVRVGQIHHRPLTRELHAPTLPRGPADQTENLPQDTCDPGPEWH